MTKQAALGTTQTDAASTGPVTVAVTQHIAAGKEHEFEFWLQGVGRAAVQFPGHQGLTVLSPTGAGRTYTYIFRFDNFAHLQAWERSAEKDRWVAQLHNLVEAPARKQIVTGLEYWFRLPGKATVKLPPRYKMAIVTVLAIYPLTTLLGWLVSPGSLEVSRLAKGLVVTVLAVGLMTYVIMPRMTRLFARWLFKGR